MWGGGFGTHGTEKPRVFFSFLNPKEREKLQQLGLNEKIKRN
jgi:hypothetical protein